MNLTCHCRVYEAVLAVQRHSPPEDCVSIYGFLHGLFATSSSPA